MAYLNSDVLISGKDYLEFRSSPMLHTAILNAAKKVFLNYQVNGCS